MKRTLFFILITVVLSAWMAPQEDTFRDQLLVRMIKLLKNNPQEKVYLHTDRDHYEVGEKVWLRAFLVDASTHCVPDYSRFVYVELRDRQDSLFSRIKLGFRDSIFAGYLPLAERLPQGDYFLRAYTYWMQNAGDDYIFRKKIRVINPRESRVKTEVTYEPAGKGYKATIRFFNSRQEVYDKVWVDYVFRDKSKVAMTDGKGEITISIDSADFGSRVQLSFKEETPFRYNSNIYLPDPVKDFDVSFMPEGGDLLVGCSQLVAFKAIGKDGLSRDVSGWIENQQGEQIAFLRSLYKGMGAVELEVKSGQRYSAVLFTADSVRKRIALPVPKSNAVALKVISDAEKLAYTLLVADSVKKDSEDFYVLLHSRGVPIFCAPIIPGQVRSIKLKELSEGISHFLVIDKEGRVYSQRLVCVHHNKRLEIDLQTDKEHYYVREPVRLGVQVLGDSLSQKSGSFSVSVIDESKTERDSLQDHILSYLLMGSDLKGYIENPAFYFKDNKLFTRRCLDVLMLTQGWTRFKVEDRFNLRSESQNYYMERGQAISGKVKNFWGKQAEDASLILLGTNGTFQVVNADSSGRFMIDGIAFADSTNFMLQGKSKRGRKSVEVVVDKDEFMTPSVRIPFRLEEQSVEDDFYKRFSKDYYYENGQKVYVLDEAVVKRKAARKSYSFYDTMADYCLDSAKLAAMGDKDIRMVLQEIPGIEAWGDSVTRFGKSIYVLVNDFEESFDFVMLLQPRDLLSISFIRSPMSTTFWGSRADNGALVITTNPNFVPREIPKLNMVSFSLLGYQKSAEFYVPRYDIDSVRLALADTSDVRTTVYWNPLVNVDGTGKTELFFTTSDSYGPYRVVIEGILNDGTVCRKEKKITLKSY